MIEFFLPPDQPVGVFLNLVIAAIAAVGIAQVVHTLVNDVRTTLKDLEDLEQKGQQDHSEALLTLAEKAKPNGLVQHRLVLLKRLQLSGEPVDTEMLAAISAETFRDAAPIARWGTSILVLLGLAGTLVGLSLAVSELSTTLLRGGMGTQEMVDAILATLGRMEVAFSTTLAGVGGSVLVGSVLAILRHQQSRAIRKLEELSSTQWAPLFKTTEESRMGDAVKELEATREILKEGLDQTLTDVRVGFEALGNQFRDQSTELLNQVGSLRDAMLEIIGERSEDSLSLAQYVETVKATTEELQEGVRASGQLLPRVQHALEETIRSEQQSLAHTLTEHTRAVRPVLERQEAAAKALGEAVSGERALLAELQDVLKRLNSSFEAASGTWEQADQAIEKMGRETAEALRDGLRETLTSVARLTEEQSKSQQRVTMSLDEFQATYRETMRLLADQSRRALNQSQEMVEGIRATLRESLDLMGERLIGSQRGNSDRVATSLNALGRELRDLAGADTSRGGLSTSAITARTPRPAESWERGDDGQPGAEGADSRNLPENEPRNLSISPEEIREDLQGLE